MKLIKCGQKAATRLRFFDDGHGPTHVGAPPGGFSRHFVMHLLHLSLTCVLCATATCAQAQGKLEARVALDSPNRLKPGEWGVLGVSVSNHSDDAATVDVVVNFESDKSREFTRSVWVPARSQRRGWLPVQAPALRPRGAWRIRSRFIRVENDAEVVQRLETSDALFEELLMSPNPARFPTLVYIDDRAPDVDTVYEAIQKTRESVSLSPILLDSKNARPASPHWLDSISVLVIAEDIHDAAATSSIRRWLRSGGRVWIMLDRVSTDTVAAIVGDDAATGVVGRETVSELELVRLPPFPASAPTVEFEDPVDFCCVADPPGTVMCTANGWPAATSFGVNNGQIIFTMAEAVAWPPEARRWLGGLVFEAERRELPWPEETISAALLEQVGQQVPPRSLVVLVLGSLVLALAAGGGWLWRQGTLDRLVWLVPCLAIAAALGLVLLGSSTRDQVPSTLATIQVAQAAQGTGRVNIRSTSLYYSTAGSDAPLSGQATIAQGVMPPPRTRNSGHGNWKWEGRFPPPGSRLYQVNDEARAHVRAIARFTDRGLEGELEGLASTEMTDVVIANHGMPSLAVRWRGDHFIASAADTLGANQHIPSEIVNDASRRRQQILGELWSGNEVGWRTDSPMMACWTAPWPDTVNWPATDRVLGDALTVIPIELRPTPPGSQVHVPGPLLRLQTRSSLFDALKSRWVGQFNGPSKFDVAFELPNCLKNLTVDSARLVFKISAPSRLVTIRDRRGQVLNELDGPAGVTITDISDQKSLVTADQRIQLFFEVSDVEGRGADSKWSIDYMLLHVEGRAN